MAPEKVKIKVAKDSGKVWKDKTIYEVELSDGRKGSCFDEGITKLPVGTEVELDVRDGKEYNGKMQYIFNLPKAGGGSKFPPKNHDFDKKRVALEQTVSLIVAGKIELKDLASCRDKFHEYLK